MTVDISNSLKQELYKQPEYIRLAKENPEACDRDLIDATIERMRVLGANKFDLAITVSRI